MQIAKKIDQLGLIGSLACAIHCALTPLVLSLLLTMGAHKMFFKGWEHIDLICLLLAPCFASLSLKNGYCKHGSKTPALIFSIGFLLLLIGYLFEKGFWHPLFMTLGGLVVASAHFLNMQLLAKSSECLSNCFERDCLKLKI